MSTPLVFKDVRQEVSKCERLYNSPQSAAEEDAVSLLLVVPADVEDLLFVLREHAVGLALGTLQDAATRRGLRRLVHRGAEGKLEEEAMALFISDLIDDRSD